MKKIHILRLMKKTTLAFTLLFSVLSNVYGQGWSLAFTLAASGLDSVRNDIMTIPAFDEDKCIPIGLYFRETSQTYVFGSVTGEEETGLSNSTHPDGASSSINHYPKSSVMVGGDTTILLVDKFNPNTGDYDVYATCYAKPAGSFFYSLVWHQPIYAAIDEPVYGTALQKTQDGQLISLAHMTTEASPNGNVNELLLIKFDLDGQIAWAISFPSPGDDKGVQVLPAPDGGFWILKNTQADLSLPEVQTWLIKTDVNGLLEWEVNLSTNDVAFDMVATADGGLAITGTNANQDLFVLKTDATGNQIWRQDYDAPDLDRSGRGIIEDLQNHIVVAGQQTHNANGEEDPFIAKLSSNGIPLWEKTTGRAGRKDGFNDIALTPAGQYLAGGFRQFSNGSNSYHGYLVRTDTFGIIKGGLVSGNVFHDFDLDCLANSGELNLKDWKVQVANDTLNYFGNTDEQGNYSIPIDAPSGSTTDYTVSVIPPNNYWIACANEIPISISFQDSMVIDFPMQGLVDCPFMQGQISSSRFRPCEEANIYINYCNTGTAVAEDAYMEVTLDENLIYNSATIAPSMIDGQTYTFPFGDLDVNTCGDFSISVTVDCNSPDSIQIGDVLCVEATLFPDSICTIPNQQWSGALLQLSYTCDNDSIQYNIENIGTGDIAQPLDYIIIEDAVLLLEGDIDNLPPAATEEPTALPFTGATYHLIAQQEPGAPGPQWISLGTMGCTNGNSTPLIEFPQLVGGPFEIIYCNTVVGSYDPNDKQAIPAGFGEEHSILPNTDINYTIRFQNTGTDTAFRVVLLDTLSSVLDPASIIAGPSSHPYEFRLLDQGVLSFTFHNIALPDSTTNLEGSQGFVTFKISQRPELPSGTLIENSAAIYFDFNPPIITNTTFHTVNRLIDIVKLSVSTVSPQLELKVIPNPMQDGAWIKVEGVDTADAITLRLFNVNGSLVKQAQGNNDGIWLERANLAPGMYFFTVETSGAWLASGKLVVE